MAAGYSTESEVISDFSDYVPVRNEDDTYDDESSMYFAKSFGVGIGTGAEFWSGAAAKVFKPAFPIFDFRLLSFSEGNWASQFGISISSHHGTPSTGVGLTSVRLMRIYVDLKYYFISENFAAHNSSDTQIASVLPFLSVGLNYLNFDIELHDQNAMQNIRVNDWNAPIFGKMPFPVLPAVAAGMDFALKPRSSSMTLELRWMPVGRYAGNEPLLDQFFPDQKFGDMLFVTTHVNFIFD
jgi:hypothetical protein